MQLVCDNIFYREYVLIEGSCVLGVFYAWAGSSPCISTIKSARVA